MDDVDRMYRHLVRTIRATSPQLLTQPFQVGDLYTTILPYRLHRRELGVETNQDYEMAMLELLSGARGYLAVDDRMRTELGDALKSPNPDPSIIRNFAQSRVALGSEMLELLEDRITGAPAPQTGSAPLPTDADTAPLRRTAPASVASTTSAANVASSSPASGPASPASPASPAGPAGSGGSGAERVPLLAPMTTGAPTRESAGAASSTAPRASGSATSATSASAPARRAPRPITVSPTGEACPHCKGALPAGREIVFCPHCGQDLTVMHCPACGSELERGWKFCVTCGRAAAGA
jgi:Double zinc ribbon